MVARRHGICAAATKTEGACRRIQGIDADNFVSPYRPATNCESLEVTTASEGEGRIGRAGRFIDKQSARPIADAVGLIGLARNRRIDLIVEARGWTRG